LIGQGEGTDQSKPRKKRGGGKRPKRRFGTGQIYAPNSSPRNNMNGKSESQEKQNELEQKPLK